ncbi:hypothetical protein Tfer_2277 [Thermincola ferriacetica]|uniref:Uncharacterized protein n=1 Tax=Thermincola ferriacetica TaxID=281456 RepID=A0A0L6W0R3_9FIRM|nr:hypothetical protein Tfer_2277 [Thermincola ferriacetica]
MVCEAMNDGKVHDVFACWKQYVMDFFSFKIQWYFVMVFYIAHFIDERRYIHGLQGQGRGSHIAG